MRCRGDLLALALCTLALSAYAADEQSALSQRWRILTCATAACDIGCKFLPALAWFTPVPEAGVVVRNHIIDGKNGRSQYNGCTITDAKNWSCQENARARYVQPTHRMIDGTPSVVGGTASQQNSSYICYQPDDR